MAENAYLEFGGDPSGPKIDKLSGSKDFNFSCRVNDRKVSQKLLGHAHYWWPNKMLGLSNINYN